MAARLTFDDSDWDDDLTDLDYYEEEYDEECGNAHESYNCSDSWHICNDCGKNLGKRDYHFEPHNGYACEICAPKPRGGGVSSAPENPFRLEQVNVAGGTVSLKELSRQYLGTATPEQTWTKLETVGNPVLDGEELKGAEVFISSNGYTTKDSGERQEYDSGMRRDIQDGKPRFDLLLVDDLPFEEQFLTRFAALLERGAVKYGENNWQLANSSEELNRFRASAMRHMMQWAAGETDEDHMAAVAFNLMAFEATKWKLENGTNDSAV